MDREVDFDYVINTEDLKDILIEVRKDTGMNRKEFSEYFQIPYRTVQDWELGNRQMPSYLLRLMVYKLGIEKMINKQGDVDEPKQL